MGFQQLLSPQHDDRGQEVCDKVIESPGLQNSGSSLKALPEEDFFSRLDSRLNYRLKPRIRNAKKVGYTPQGGYPMCQPITKNTGNQRLISPSPSPENLRSIHQETKKL